MPLQSNVWFGAVPPANVPTPAVGYLAVFISDGSAGTTFGVLYKKDSAGTVTPVQDHTGDFTNAKAQDAVGGALQSSDTVALTYNTSGRFITANVIAGSINTTHLTDGGIQSGDIADAAIIPAKLADLAVTSAKLTDLAVSTVKIVDGAVTTLKIADTSVTNAKMAAMAQATFKMRAAGTGTGQPVDGTAAQAKTALAIQAADVSGLGTAATMNATAFDAAGAATAAQAASQPLDSDLTAIAALSTTSYGRSLLTLADATALTALVNVATTSVNGLLSAADKTKLNNLGAGSGSYSVIQYGITTSNTGAANLAAWNALMASIPDNSTVSFPPSASPYTFSDTLAIPTGKHLRITGSSNQKSIIQTSHASNDMFTVGDWYNEFNGLKFQASVTRTAGAAINSGNNVSVNVTNCDFAGMWDGIVYTGGVNAGNLALVSNCQFTGTLNRGIVLDGTNANTIIEKVIMDGTLGVQQVGLDLVQCGSVLVSNSDFIRAVNNCRFNPVSPNGVFSAYFVNVFFDTSSASSVKFTNTGNVQRVKFTNCWFSGSVIGCEFASTAATLPTAIDFVNCDIFGNSGRGIYANGVQDFNVTNCRIAGNTTAGVETNASTGSVTKFNLANNSICPTAGFGANGVGVLINAGTYGGYALKNNDVRSNSTANISDSGSVATTDLKIINDNFGHIITGSIANLVATASASGTTLTGLLTARVPAKAAVVGQVFRFKLLGNCSAAGTFTFHVHAGASGSTSDTVAWTSVTSASLSANNRAGFEGLLTVRSASSVQCEGLGFGNTGLLPSATAAPATVAVTTTGAWFITLSVTGSLASGFVAQQAVVEAL
jgi:hypothetical protein